MEALIDYGGLSALSLFAVAFSAPVPSLPT